MLFCHLKNKAGPVELNRNMSGDRIVIPAFLQIEARATYGNTGCGVFKRGIQN